MNASKCIAMSVLLHMNKIWHPPHLAPLQKSQIIFSFGIPFHLQVSITSARDTELPTPLHNFLFTRFSTIFLYITLSIC